MSSKIGICLTCGKEGVMSVCSRCKNADYCSVTCQKRDWKNHKPHCKAKKKAGDGLVCSCPICGRDGLERQCPVICARCGQLKHCEMCFFDKRSLAIGRGTLVCNQCIEQDDDPPFLQCLQQLKDRLRPEDAGPLENALRLGYAGLQEDPDGPLLVKVDMKEVHRLADEIKYAPAMYVLGALYAGMNETEAGASGQNAKDGFMLGLWTSLFRNSYTHCDEDVEKAQKYLKQAADLGYAQAMIMLGSFYFSEFNRNVELVNKLRDAFVLMREAANMGHATAAVVLARMISDPATAVVLGEACDLEKATRLLKRVVRKATPFFAESAREMLEKLTVLVESD